MTQIVVVTIQQQVAPTPATLQQCYAAISQGATVLAPSTYAIITQPSDLTPLLMGSHTLASLSWSAGVVTATAVTPHGFLVGDSLYVTIAGATPAAYNGTYFVTVTSPVAFTYPLAINPGAISIPGIYTVEDVNELLQQVTEWFAQGFQTALFVLELGAGGPTDGVATLNAYITANPNQNYTPGATGYFYAYIVPRSWDANPAFLAFLPQFTGNTSRTYFWVTTTLATYTLYGIWKCVLALIEAYATGSWPANVLTSATWNSSTVQFQTTTNHGVLPGQWFQIQGCTPNAYNGWYLAITGTATNVLVAAKAINPGTSVTLGTLVASAYAYPGIGLVEFSAAAAAWVAATWNPSPVNRVPPLSYVYLSAVTPFPTQNNYALLSTLKTANINTVQTGGEGGISNTILTYGKTLDGRAFNYWYSVDWFAINADINIANAVINGSNNSLAPLYYNQDGIDKLQSVIQATAASAITFGLATGQIVLAELPGIAFSQALQDGTYAGQIVINAVPLLPYLEANPGDYKAQVYKGYGVQYIPQLGFEQIFLTVVVTDFLTT